MNQQNTNQEQRSGNNDPFDILDPATVAAQEAQGRRLSQQAEWMSRASMTPQQGINYNLVSGVGGALGALADKVAPLPDSPGVARARILQGVLKEAQGIQDPIAQREFMARRMLELGQNQEAGKFQEQVLKMRKANFDNDKTGAETANLKVKVEEDFAKAAMNDGYNMSQVSAALALRKAGNPDWRSVLTDKHSDTRWVEGTIEVPNSDGRGKSTMAVIRQTQGPDKGKVIRLGADTQIVNNNNSQGGAGGSAVMSPAQSADRQQESYNTQVKQVSDAMTGYRRVESDVDVALGLADQLTKDPANSVAAEALVKGMGRAVMGGSGNALKGDAAIGEAGSVLNTLQNMVLRAGGAGVTGTTLGEVKRTLVAVKAAVQKRKEQEVNGLASFSKTIGYSDDVAKGLANQYGITLKEQGNAPDVLNPTMATPQRLGEIASERAKAAPQVVPAHATGKDSRGFKTY